MAAGARFLLCDNMSPDLLRSTVEAVRGTGEAVEIEATGNLTLEVAAAYAATGVDFLSVGGLTHSSRSSTSRSTSTRRLTRAGTPPR